MDRAQYIVVSGMGCISAAGNNLAEALDSFEANRVNVGTITVFPSELNLPVFETKISKDYISQNLMRTFALADHAIEEALADSGLNSELLARFRVGVCLGTTVASQFNDIDFYRKYKETGEGPIEPIERYLNSNLAEAVKRKYLLKGPGMTVVNACSSGADAIGTGLSWLKSGICDIVIAGGADELSHVTCSGFHSLGITSESPCKPFDKNRNGLNLGEGAGIMVLETDNVTKRRGNNSKLMLKGYGTFADGYHLTAPRPDGSGLLYAIKYALKEADMSAGNISFINAHGTATHDNDKVEGKVFRELFGEKFDFLSTKGYIGHTLGAAGALEAIFSCAALRHSWIPKSAGFEEFDEEIGISPVMGKTKFSGNAALSTSLAFGGNNSALIFELK